MGDILGAVDIAADNLTVSLFDATLAQNMVADIWQAHTPFLWYQ